MNLPLIIIVAAVALALVVFLIIRNQKDEKNFENQLDNDYQKPRNEEGDIDIDDLTNQAH